MESHRLLVETYGEHAPSIRTCETWFRQFKSGDINVKDSARSGRPQKCEDEQLQALLDDDPTQTQQQLEKALNVSQETISRRLRAMGKIHKLGKWVPYDLNERQMENRKVTCEMLLQRHERKSFLHRIVTGDEKWMILLHDNAPSHNAKAVKDTLKSLGWDTRRTPPTWRHLTITSSHQWGTRSQSSTSAISRKLENGSTNGLPQKTNSFSGMVFMTYLKDGRSV